MLFPSIIAALLLPLGGCTLPDKRAGIVEYRVVSSPLTDPLQSELNKLSEAGWEVVAAGHQSDATAFVILQRRRK